MTEFLKREPEAPRVRIDFVCTDRERHRLIKLGHVGYLAMLTGRQAQNAPERPYWSEDGETFLGGYKPGELARRTRDGKAVLSPYVRVQRSMERTEDGWDEGSYELLCPKCGRNPSISGTRLRAAVAALREAGITEVDISRLPF